ncbi:MAG: HAD family hydrolase [Burkholderiales bacterium]
MTSRAVLFDFDGTFADTAADLAAAVNAMREKRALAPLAPEVVRPYASMGARGLLRIGFDMLPDDARYIAMRDEFLDNYAGALCVHTRVFPGMEELLRKLGARDIAWGIVTNKATRFARPLVEQLKVRPACLICGDSTPHLKPHPAPLLAATEALALAPADCAYVGDDLRDMQAAHAAGMRAIAVQYGYHGTDNPGPTAWNADAIIDHPLELLEHL